VHESLRAVSVVGLEVEDEAGVAAAAVPHSVVSEVVLEWTSATELVAIVARIERGLGAVAGPEVVP
jgi:hypothetical protein